MSASDGTPVLILSGAPGVGKTTVAALLATRSARSVHLEADAFFRFISSGYVRPWRPESREQNELVMRLVGQAATGYAGAGYLTIVDGIVLPGWSLEPLRDALREAGHPVAYAVLREPPAVCAARAGDRERHPFSDADVIERLCRSFADLGDFERNALPLEGRQPEQAAALVSRRWDAGTLSI